MPFTDNDLKRLKHRISRVKYKTPWTPKVIDRKLWYIETPERELITCDAGYYGPGIPDGRLICDLRNKIEALLARLEAAEECAEYLDAMGHTDFKGNEAERIIKVWRRITGK